MANRAAVLIASLAINTAGSEAPAIGLPRGLALAHRPSVAARSDADLLPEPARAMALIRKPGSARDFRKRHIRRSQEFLHTPHATSHQILIRGHALRLFECTGEVRHRQARRAGQHYN